MVKQNTHELNKIKIHTRKRDSFTLCEKKKSEELGESEKTNFFQLISSSQYFCVCEKMRKMLNEKQILALYASAEKRTKGREERLVFGM